MLTDTGSDLPPCHPPFSILVDIKRGLRENYGAPLQVERRQCNIHEERIFLSLNSLWGMEPCENSPRKIAHTNAERLTFNQQAACPFSPWSLLIISLLSVRAWERWYGCEVAMCRGDQDQLSLALDAPEVQKVEFCSACSLQDRGVTESAYDEGNTT